VQLRDRWARRLGAHERARLYTSLRPGFAYGMATIRFDGLDSERLAAWLLEEHGILVAAVAHEQLNGIRVSPSVYTTLEEIDRFGDAIEQALRDGLPA
jgi:selenocysteine lyase/cysteine desulfurase